MSKRVLIVEDEALIVFLLEEMISDSGFEAVAVANKLSDAIAVSPDSFDMAILDVSLHGVQVFPLAEILRKQGKPFAFATGRGNSDIPEIYRNAPVLQKPYQQDALDRVLKQMAGGGNAAEKS
jgi:DNA-binding response OmpR family regulator